MLVIRAYILLCTVPLCYEEHHACMLDTSQLAAPRYNTLHTLCWYTLQNYFFSLCFFCKIFGRVLRLYNLIQQLEHRVHINNLHVHSTPQTARLCPYLLHVDSTGYTVTDYIQQTIGYVIPDITHGIGSQCACLGGVLRKAYIRSSVSP